jgi:hypothetical protein
MKVQIDIAEQPKGAAQSTDMREADLFVIGRCLAVEVDGTIHRMYLTPSQWALLARAAEGAGHE